MKPSIYLICILAFFACEDEATQFEDIAGNWTFKSESFSGNFKIAKALDGSYAVEPGASFKINGNNYQSSYDYELMITGLHISAINLGNEDAFIILQDISYTAGFTKMTNTSQNYAVDCIRTSCPHLSKEEEVIMTRL